MEVKLIESMGSDLTVVNAARVSFSKESDWATNWAGDIDGLLEQDEKLINYLAKHNHWTPFSHVRETFTFLPEHCWWSLSVEQKAGMVCKEIDGKLKVRHSLWGWASILPLLYKNLAECIARELTILYPECCKALGIAYTDAVDRDVQYRHIPSRVERDPDYIDLTMREKVPIFVARQRFKHMVGFTYNEVSRRYVDDEPEFFVPDVWRSRPEGSVKQGSGKKSIKEIEYTDKGSGEIWERDIYNAYELCMEQCLDLYNAMLKSGVAPEQARMSLPQSMYTEYYVTGSLAAWARAYKQRIDAHAQVEIQDLAKQWDEIIRPLFPESWSALVDGS